MLAVGGRGILLEFHVEGNVLQELFSEGLEVQAKALGFHVLGNLADEFTLGGGRGKLKSLGNTLQEGGLGVLLEKLYDT